MKNSVSIMDTLRNTFKKSNRWMTSNEVLEKSGLNLENKRCYDKLWLLAQRGELEWADIEVNGRKRTAFRKPSKLN